MKSGTQSFKTSEIINSEQELKLKYIQIYSHTQTWDHDTDATQTMWSSHIQHILVSCMLLKIFNWSLHKVQSNNKHTKYYLFPSHHDQQQSYKPPLNYERCCHWKKKSPILYSFQFHKLHLACKFFFILTYATVIMCHCFAACVIS